MTAIGGVASAAGRIALGQAHEGLEPAPAHEPTGLVTRWVQCISPLTRIPRLPLQTSLFELRRAEEEPKGLLILDLRDPAVADEQACGRPRH